jgi:hypothetical protein
MEMHVEEKIVEEMTARRDPRVCAKTVIMDRNSGPNMYWSTAMNWEDDQLEIRSVLRLAPTLPATRIGFPGDFRGTYMWIFGGFL